MTALQDQFPVQKLLTAIHVNKMAKRKALQDSNKENTVFSIIYQ
jgi:hypothetical protein